MRVTTDAQQPTQEPCFAAHFNQSGMNSHWVGNDRLNGHTCNSGVVPVCCRVVRGPRGGFAGGFAIFLNSSLKIECELGRETIAVRVNHFDGFPFNPDRFESVGHPTSVLYIVGDLWPLSIAPH